MALVRTWLIAAAGVGTVAVLLLGAYALAARLFL